MLRDGFAVAAGGRLSVTVDPALATSGARDFAYQDVQYYLTRADGPWGERDWTYDRIGNRLTETRNRSGSPEQDAYLYEPNPATGNTPNLDEILLAFGGARDYTWGAAGHLAQVASGGNQVDLAADAASRMSAAARSDGTTIFAEATFTYDGRSYLTAAIDPSAGTSVTPVYSSEGLLMALEEHTGPTLDRRHLIFYFAGRPVAQWTDTAGTETWHHYTTDHLGTPILATDASGTELWRSRLDSFGADPDRDTVAGALEHDVFLRLAGQWDSNLWSNAVLGTGDMYYNVFRWYSPGIGSYTRPDPVTADGRGSFFYSGNMDRPYTYAMSNPLRRIDPLGLCSLLTLYDELDRRRVEGHNRFPRAENSYMRHCTISCESAMACGPWMIPLIRVAGVGNEIQGLVLHDLPNLGRRWSGDEPWAFQPEDLFDNEDGFFCSARTRRNPCQTCEQCCQSNLDSGRQLRRVFAKTVLETVPPPRTPLYGWP